MDLGLLDTDLDLDLWFLAIHSLRAFSCDGDSDVDLDRELEDRRTYVRGPLSCGLEAGLIHGFHSLVPSGFLTNNVPSSLDVSPDMF